MSGCKCFSNMLDKVKEQLMPQIPEGATEVDFRWQDATFFLDGGDYSPVNPKVQVKYRKPKKGGGHAKSVTKDSISILCTYCPFCGRKLDKDSEKSG